MGFRLEMMQSSEDLAWLCPCGCLIDLMPNVSGGSSVDQLLRTCPTHKGRRLTRGRW